MNQIADLTTILLDEGGYDQCKHLVVVCVMDVNTEQVEDLLRRGPPTHLVSVTEMLDERAKITLARFSSLACQ